MRIRFKHIILSVLLLSFGAAECQKIEDYQEKYWKFRNRLTHDFMIGVGPEQGQSLPANIRKVPGLYNYLKYGDQTSALGFYYGLLSMEYVMLAANGENTDQTVKELFYALYAFNRLDLGGETLYNDQLPDSLKGEPKLDGFFIRDDVPPATPEVLAALNTDPELIPVERIYSDYVQSREKGRGNIASKDQVVHLLTGFAFIDRLIPDSLYYTEDGEKMYFQDSCLYLKSAAHAIVNRIIDNMHESPWKWGLNNPYSGERIPRENGGYAWDLSWGLDQVRYNITGKKAENSWHPAILLSSTGFKTVANSPLTIIMRRVGELDKMLNLMSNGNLLGDRTLDWLFEHYRDPKGVYTFFHIPLNHMILYPEASSSHPDKDKMLDELLFYISDIPERGAYNYGQNPGGNLDTGYASFHWSSTNRLTEPEIRGLRGEPADTKKPHYGDYNNLDWMYYHNLYCILSGRFGHFRYLTEE